MFKSRWVVSVSFLLLISNTTFCDPTTPVDIEIVPTNVPANELTPAKKAPILTNVANTLATPEKGRMGALVEFKAGYFFFSDDLMQKVYDDGGVDFQLSGCYPIWKKIHIYGSVEYLERWGKSLNAGQKTRIWEIPLSLGLKPVFSIYKTLDYYFAVGPRYVFANVHNQSNDVPKSLNQNGIGGFVNTGFAYFPYRHLVLDVFGEYSYVKLHFHPHRTNVYSSPRQIGGFTFGGGIGYAF